jgi:site-specific recombinase XerD
MKVIAHLKTPKKTKSSIILTISDSRNINIKHSTGIIIDTDDWNQNTESVEYDKKKTNRLKTKTNANTINQFIQARKKLVTEIYLDYKSKNIIPTGKQIAKDVRSKLGKTIDTENLNFWQFWEAFLHKKKHSYSKGAIQKYEALKTHLLDFEKADKLPLNLQNITKNTLQRLEAFFYQKKNFNTQTTGKYIQFLKSFLNWCVENKHTTNQDFKFFKVSQQPDTLKVALSEKELDLIRKADLQGKNYLENVRKLFLLSCLTGLRFSDYVRVKSEHLKYDEANEPILSIRMEKTNDFVEIPLQPESETIVKELIEGKVRAITNQKMNKYVKELCKLAGLTEPFEVHTFKGSLKVSSVKPKYELISSHTGRRTFATNLLNNGVPAEIVMQFTGHRDYKSFSKYINIPKKTQINIVRKAMRNAVMSVA